MRIEQKKSPSKQSDLQNTFDPTNSLQIHIPAYTLAFLLIISPYSRPTQAFSSIFLSHSLSLIFATLGRPLLHLYVRSLDLVGIVGGVDLYQTFASAQIEEAGAKGIGLYVILAMLFHHKIYSPHFPSPSFLVSEAMSHQNSKSLILATLKPLGSIPFWPQLIKPKRKPASPATLYRKKAFPIKCLGNYLQSSLSFLHLAFGCAN